MPGDRATIAFAIRFVPIPQRDGKRTDLLCSRGPHQLPLRVNLKTKSVEVEAALKTQTWAGDCLLATEHGVLRSTRASTKDGSVDRLTLWSPPTAKDEPWKETPLGDEPLEQGRDLEFIQQGDALLKVGAAWSRYDLIAKKRELLTTGRLPAWQRFGRYAHSAHYGVVGWFRSDGDAWENRLFQIHIDHADPPKPDRTLAFRNVPADVRAKHQAAVHDIIDLGGTARSPDSTYTFSSVCFGKDYKGGGKGLAHLKNIYNLGTVQLVGAPVSDDDLTQLDHIADLRKLELVETEVTDAGLGTLKSLHNLWAMAGGSARRGSFLRQRFGSSARLTAND